MPHFYSSQFRGAKTRICQESVWPFMEMENKLANLPVLRHATRALSEQPFAYSGRTPR